MAKGCTGFATAIGLFFALAPATLTAWGGYGHEQISDAAVTLLEEGRVPSALSGWLATNRKLLQRLSVTPDCEWKANRGCRVPEDEHLAALVYRADSYEHPLHFFEPDAFVRGGAVTAQTADLLPGGVYLDIFREYIRLFADNIDYVMQFPRKKPIGDPAQPTAREVAESGTAPWRVRQLFDLAVKAFVENRTELALLYLGTLSHYVGDLSQPLHTTMNYDGQVHSPSARGVHAAFESKILERVARQAKAKKDTDTKLWSHFRATEKQVLAAARAYLTRAGSLVAADEVVREILRMATQGFSRVAPLLEVFTDVVEPESSVTAEEQQQFLEAAMPGTDGSVLALAEDRMGASAALLARLWESAWAAARRAGAPSQAPSGAFAFDVALVLENYPVPHYLPKDAMQAGHGGEHEEAHHEDDRLDVF